MHYRFAFIAHSCAFYREMYVFYIKNMHFDLITGKRTIRSKFSFPGVLKNVFLGRSPKKKVHFFPPRRAPGGGIFQVLGAWRAKMDEKIFFFTGAANDCRKKCCPKNTFIKRAPRRPAGHFPPYEGRRRPSPTLGGGRIPPLPPPGGGRPSPVGTGERGYVQPIHT